MDPFFAYDANYLIDNKVGIILDAEGTRANRIEEIAISQTMRKRASGSCGQQLYFHQATRNSFAASPPLMDAT
jgi:hypothetical protein